MIAILASFLLSTNATPRELVESCRAMIPANVSIEGRIILRNRRGVVKAEHGYRLTRLDSKTALAIDGRELAPPPAEKSGTPVMETDVTWSDIALDYLWWDDFSFDAEREGETVHGQVCAVLMMKKGNRTVRVWVDRKTGALMQAEEISGGKPLRRMWGTRIKKFGERWMANVMEVETIGSGHRTKITGEKLQ